MEHIYCFCLYLLNDKDDLQINPKARVKMKPNKSIISQFPREYEDFQKLSFAVFCMGKCSQKYATH